MVWHIVISGSPPMLQSHFCHQLFRFHSWPVICSIAECLDQGRFNPKVARKWMEMDGNGWKWMEMDGLPPLFMGTIICFNMFEPTFRYITLVWVCASPFALGSLYIWFVGVVYPRWLVLFPKLVSIQIGRLDCSNDLFKELVQSWRFVVWLVVWNILLFFHILGFSSSQLTNSYFSEG